MNIIDEILGHAGRPRGTAAAVCVVALLVVSAGFAGGTIAQSSPTVGVADAQVDPGNTTEVTLTLNEAPEGVAGFDLRVALVDNSVATITDVQVDGGYGMTNTSVAADGSSAYGSGVDTDRNFEPGAQDVPLITVTLEGVENGTTAIDALDVHIDDDSGNNVEASVDPGTLTVGDGEQSTPTPTEGGTTTETTATATPSNGGGGGGGGGGQTGSDGASGETKVYDTDAGATVWFTDIQQAPSLAANVSGATGAGVSVEGVGIDLRFNTDRFRTEVTDPTASPPGETPAFEQATAYFTVEAHNLDWDSVDGANLTVSVEESAVPEGGVQLYHYTDGEWVALNTTATGDGTYTAPTNGFSPFAVGAPQDDTSTGDGTATATPSDGTSTDSSTDADSGTTQSPADSTETESDGGIGGTTIAALGGLLLVLLGVLVLRG